MTDTAIEPSTVPAARLETERPGLSVFNLSPRWTRIFIGALALLTIVRVLLPYVLRQDKYHSDACQHVWWTYKFADPQLFPNDYIEQFMSLPIFAPRGWRMLFQVFAPFVDAQVFSEILAIGLGACIWIFAFLLGRAAARGAYLGGLIAGIYLVYAELTNDVVGGFARSFGSPVLMFGLWTLMTNRLPLFGAALLIGSLMYPPVCITLGLTAAISLGWPILRDRKLPKGWLPMGVLGLIAFLLIASAYLRQQPGAGHKTTGEEARTMPEFQEGGRSEFWGFKWKDFWFSKQRSGLGVRFEKLIYMGVFVGVSAWLFRGLLPPAAWAMLFSSLGIFVAAHLMLFKLYLPNRHTAFAVPLFGMLWLCAVIPRALELLARDERIRRAIDALTSPRARVAAGVVTIVLYTPVVGAWVYTTMVNYPHDKLTWRWVDGWDEAAAFLRDNTPKDTLVAAHPFDADRIPLLARRSVLANRETAMAFFMGFYQKVPERIEAELAATYASDWADVDKLAEYGVDVFFINTRRLWSQNSVAYHHPHRDRNMQRYRENREKGFVLANPPPERVIYKSKSGLVMLVRVGPPKEADRQIE